MKTVSASAEKNLSLVRRAVAEIWNGLDLDLADSLFTSGYINHGGIIPDLVFGSESIKFAVVLQHTAFPHLHICEQSAVAEDNLVELKWTARHGAPIRRNQADSTRYTAQGTTLILCEGDRIAESWTTWSCPASLEAAA